MQAKLPENENQYGFEISEEVLEKIQRAENLHVLIDEQKMADLRYIDVSKNRYRLLKRAIDIVCSAFGLLLLLVPMSIVALAIYADDPGKPIFAQYRVGLGGRRFKVFKFRTMKKDTPKYLSTMEVADPDQYITRIGRFLRKSSIDELPQLLNVLKGDMSLVGPRPLISDEYEIHGMRMKLGVYNVRPGVTGLAQINGRDTVSPAEKVRWDVKYLENFGLLMDIRILFATVPKIFGGAGIIEGFDSSKNGE